VVAAVVGAALVVAVVVGAALVAVVVGDALVAVVVGDAVLAAVVVGAALVAVVVGDALVVPEEDADSELLVAESVADGALGVLVGGATAGTRSVADGGTV
jgi:hypothetical protein